MSRASARRGLLVALILLAIVWTAMDLMSSDSVLRAAWRSLTASNQETVGEKMLQQFRRDIRPEGA